jgi:hypothetical protein
MPTYNVRLDVGEGLDREEPMEFPDAQAPAVMHRSQLRRWPVIISLESARLIWLSR